MQIDHSFYIFSKLLRNINFCLILHSIGLQGIKNDPTSEECSQNVPRIKYAVWNANPSFDSRLNITLREFLAKDCAFFEILTVHLISLGR